MQTDKLERLRERMVKVRELFRDTDATEFVIVTIPTVNIFTNLLNRSFISLFTKKRKKKKEALFQYNFIHFEFTLKENIDSWFTL